MRASSCASFVACHGIRGLYAECVSLYEQLVNPSEDFCEVRQRVLSYAEPAALISCICGQSVAESVERNAAVAEVGEKLPNAPLEVIQRVGFVGLRLGCHAAQCGGEQSVYLQQEGAVHGVCVGRTEYLTQRPHETLDITGLNLVFYAERGKGFDHQRLYELEPLVKAARRICADFCHSAQHCGVVHAGDDVLREGGPLSIVAWEGALQPGYLEIAHSIFDLSAMTGLR